jgi:hypothetical protein
VENNFFYIKKHVLKSVAKNLNVNLEEYMDLYLPKSKEKIEEAKTRNIYMSY